MTPVTNEYVQFQNGGYYVAGTRISLDSVLHAFRRGESPESILEDFPAIGSLAAVYGAIAFLLQYPAEIEQYLAAVDRKWEEGRTKNPPALAERIRRARRDGTVRSA